MKTKRWGFTLIELMIVVVIIGIIAAIAIPAMLGTLQQEESATEEEDAPEQIAQAPPSAEIVDEAGEAGPAAVIESSDVLVKLRAFEVLEGFSVKTHYDLRFEGRFVIRNPMPAERGVGEVRMTFPFPRGISEARDVSLWVDSGGGLEEAKTAVYGLEGISWSGRVPGESTVEAKVLYAARGREAFGYDVAGTGRSGSVRFEMQLEDVDRPMVPTDALQPTERSDDRLVWQFEKLITNDAIRLELPAGSSPLGRIILLCQLAGIAVLLFGAGFWFLAEGYRPRMLDDFRWGHFLLLGLNFALFFAIFAVVGYEGSAEVALGVSAGVSLPLLTVHVRRVVDLPFALSRNLPLAIFALGVVVAGVYIEDLRAYIFLGAGVFLIAFVTMTYNGWASGRKAASDVWERKRQRERRAYELDAFRVRVREGEAALSRRMRQLREVLEGSSPELVRSRDTLEKALEEADEALRMATAIEEEDLSELEDEAHAGRVSALSAELSECESAMNAVDLPLRESGLVLEEEQRQLEAALYEVESHNDTLRQRALVKLGTCRRVLDEEHDAAVAQEHERLEEVCAKVEGALSAQPEEAEGLELRRMQLEAYGRELERHTKRLVETQLGYESAREQIRERARQVQGEPEEHCPACGSTRDSGSRFCPDCGTSRPLKVACRKCGTTLELPVHLLTESWSASAVHCRCCGQAFEAAQLPEPVVDPA